MSIGAVRLAGRRVLLADVRAAPERFAREFAEAKSADGNGWCLCRPSPLRLQIRCTHSGYQHLAVWPLEGARHAARCPFYRVAPELSGRTAYSAAAIREYSGGVAIRFAVPLTVSSVGVAGQRAEPAVGGVGRNSVGVVGLLHFLWDAAGLTTWHGDVAGRSWGAVVQAVAPVLAECTINQRPATDLLFVVPPYREGMGQSNVAAFDRFLDRLRPAGSQVPRGLVLGEVRAITEARHGFGYELAQQSRGRKIFVREDLHARLQASFRSAFSRAATDAGGRRVIVAVIERTEGGRARAVDAGVMLTSGRYVPADSSYEIRMADALARAGRSYIKPLRYDAETDAVLPDFTLIDEEHVYVEVWGLPGRVEYERRKAVKVQWYQRHAARLIEWTVTEPMPALHRPSWK